MTRNPFINGLAALLYIIVVAVVLYYGGRNIGPVNSFVGPVAGISLFTLSAAMMGYLFLYQPAMLYFDGRKKEGVNLFLQTLAVFGMITILLLALLFSGAFSAKKQSHTVPPATSNQSKEAAGMANPASVYCVEQGGESRIITTPDGSQTGECIFADGRKCDEWDFFRTKTCGQ